MLVDGGRLLVGLVLRGDVRCPHGAGPPSVEVRAGTPAHGEVRLGARSPVGGSPLAAATTCSETVLGVSGGSYAGLDPC